MSVRKINPPELVASDFEQMGQQLTTQYQRAVSGMVEIVKFGAMMAHVRNTLSNVDKVSARGKALTGNGIKGDGLKAWLEQYAPDVKRATAYRFEDVTQAMAEEYVQIVGTRVANKYSLPELVLAEKLPKQAQAKQLQFFEYISGTSQRSWLDRFSRKKEPESENLGGKRNGAGRKKKDFNGEAELARLEWKALQKKLGDLMSDNSWIHLEEKELKELDGTLLDLRRELEEVLKGGDDA